jgi:hypothetical protein
LEKVLTYKIVETALPVQESYIEIRIPKRVRWVPQEDITTYELSLAIMVLIAGPHLQFPEDSVANLPTQVQRHFVVEEIIR